MNFVLEKNSNLTFAQQIARQIVSAIEKGELVPGGNLMSERKLAEKLDVSRGTVRSAYSYLQENGYIISRMGGGHKVVDPTEENSLIIDRANRIIDEMFKNLDNLNISTYEISKLMNVKLLEREKGSNKIRIALIECRKDILYLFEKQLEQFKDTTLSFFQVDEFIQSPQLARLAMDCDIVLTTASHYGDVSSAYPELGDKLVEIVTTWSKKTVFELASIKETSKIGVLYNSPRTVHLVESALKYFGIQSSSFKAFNEGNKRSLAFFLKDQTVIIAEPLSCIFENDMNNDIARTFQENGGTIIKFEHVIDDGSLMIIGQAISNFLEKNR